MRSIPTPARSDYSHAYLQLFGHLPPDSKKGAPSHKHML